MAGPMITWMLLAGVANKLTSEGVVSVSVACLALFYPWLQVRELQKWAGEVGFQRDHCPLPTLSSLVATQYCDLVCQVVATVVEEEGVCFVARVWDGTGCQ